MKYIILTLIFLSFVINAAAQSNYKKGYIITNKNDTINGYIDFRTDEMNSTVCKFRKTARTKEEIFYPGDIRGYMFIDEVKYYVTRTVQIDNTFKIVFLEYLVQGVKDLYYYSENIDYYFIEDENGKMISVTKKPDCIIDNKYKVDNKYKGRLMYAFRDCESVEKDISDVGFDRSSLIKLTKKYHQKMCSPGEECIIFENNYKKIFLKLDFSIYSGLQVMNFKYGENELSQFKSSSSLSPVIGGQVEISNPRLIKSLRFQLGAALSYLKGFNDFAGENTYYQNFEFKSCMGTGIFGLKYIYPKGNVLPVVEIGISYSRLFNSSNTLYEESYINDFLVTSTSSIPLSKSYSGYYFGAGLNCKIKNEHSVFCRVVFNKMFSSSDNVKGFQVKLGFDY